MDSEENSSRNSTILQTGITDFSLQFYLPQNRKRWKQDKTCLVCTKQLTGFMNPKKYFCKFCYRAVCADCSKQRVKHPQSSKTERICTTCLQGAFQKQYQQGYSDQLLKVIADQQDIRSQIQRQIQLKTQAADQCRLIQHQIKQLQQTQGKFQQMEQKIIKLEAQRAKLQLNNLNLKKQIQASQEVNLQKTRELDQLEKQVTDRKGGYKGNRNQVSHLRNQLAQSQDENLRLLNILDQNNITNSRIKKKNKKQEILMTTIQNLSQEYLQLKQEKEMSQKEIKKIEIQLKEINEKITSLKSEMSELSSVSSSREIVSEDKAKVIDLRLKVDEQQIYIQKLKKQIQNEMNKRKKLLQIIYIYSGLGYEKRELGS